MSNDTLILLYGRANVLADREITVTETQDGKHIVEFMSFSAPPPPKGETEEEALELFIQQMLKRREEKSSIEKDDTVKNTGEFDGESDKPGS